MFHPAGILCRARVEIVTEEPHLRAVAERLQGSALVRLSSALWKAHEWPDVLGCALRFSENIERVVPLASDQDLLLATIRRPWTLPFAPLSTRYQDFFENCYYAVSPFEVPPLGRVEWRLVPEPGSSSELHREDRLLHRLAAGTANFLLECARYRSPWKAFDERPFRPVVRVRALEVSELDQEALRFDPFQAGRDLTPVGFVHSLRRATYASSQQARPKWQNAGAASG
ncbi:MAG TPA: hypothetical protein VG937_17090 [Polyangiaceae bacterium]|nr:hypothetical protein [Polyangiaceae bacterium]